MISNTDVTPGVSKKLIPKYRGPYEVTKCLPNDRYLIKDIEGFQLYRIYVFMCYVVWKYLLCDNLCYVVWEYLNYDTLCFMLLLYENTWIMITYETYVMYLCISYIYIMNEY